MGSTLNNGWRGQKPMKSRRRILCPTLPAGAERPRGSLSGSLTHPPPSGNGTAANSAYHRPPSVDQLLAARMPVDQAPPRPFVVTVRVLFFSRDGAQADNGAAHEIPVTTTTTVEDLLMSARAAAGLPSGHLLFKMRPLGNMMAMLSECGITAEPKALHLMVSRKFRPPEVAEMAAAEAAKVSQHVAAAAAAAPPKQMRQSRPMSAGSETHSEIFEESFEGK